jgi:5'-AMP-activated protein kinase catalytic alpha subunit
MRFLFFILKCLKFKQWKYINSSIYNLRVRKRINNSDRFVKVGLQLYQVDNKSYLLDFRSFDVDGVTGNSN